MRKEKQTFNLFALPQEERRAVFVGRLRSDCTRTELKRRFEVFGEIEECAVNLRDDG